MLGALADTVVGALRQRLGSEDDEPVLTPGANVSRELSPPPDRLVDDFVRYLGGDPKAYRGVLPAHLFPQWAMPSLVRAMRGLPYPMLRGVNAGCRLKINAPLPRGETLHVEAHLAAVEQGERKVLLVVEGTTSTASSPRALEHDLRVSVPLPKGRANGGQSAAPRARPENRVPNDAREIARFRLRADAGRAFAALTGDVNPIHWLAPYARASGFPSVILHGFGTFAHAVEGLTRAHFAGDPQALAAIDVRFTRPLVLPADVGLYLRGADLAVGDAPGGPAYMIGRQDARVTRPAAPAGNAVEQ